MPQVEQVGGDHYITNDAGVCPNCRTPLQHWDYAAKKPYLVASVSKYLDRFQVKGGWQGVLKALSFLYKLMVTYYPVEFAEWREEEDRLAYERYVDKHDSHPGPAVTGSAHKIARRRSK